MDIQSIHQARLLVALREAVDNPSRHFGNWLTTKELAEAARIARRTATQWLGRLRRADIVQCEDVFPGPLWALKDTPKTKLLLAAAVETLERRQRQVT